MASQYYYFTDFFEALERWGFMDVLLPFLLVFTVIFAILQKIRLFGQHTKNFNAVIALCIALIVVIPHVTDSYPSENWDPVVVMNKALPTVSILILAILMMLVLIGLFGGEAEWMGGSLSAWIAIISLVLIILVFGGSAGWWGDSWDNIVDFFGEEAVSLVVMVLVFAIIVAWITSGGEGERKAGALSAFGKSFQEAFKKQ